MRLLAGIDHFLLVRGQFKDGGQQGFKIGAVVHLWQLLEVLTVPSGLLAAFTGIHLAGPVDRAAADCGIDHCRGRKLSVATVPCFDQGVLQHILGIGLAA